MGGGWSEEDHTVHVANASHKSILARIAENEINLKELVIEVHADLNIKSIIDIGGSAHAAWDIVFHRAGFATIGPKNYLDYKVSDGGSKIFVTIYEIDGDKLKPVCQNYIPPRDKSILYTTSGVKPSEKIAPFKPVIDQDQAALIAKRDPRHAGSANYKCGLDESIGDVVCWVTEDGQRYTSDMGKGVNG